MPPLNPFAAFTDGTHEDSTPEPEDTAATHEDPAATPSPTHPAPAPDPATEDTAAPVPHEDAPASTPDTAQEDRPAPPLAKDRPSPPPAKDRPVPRPGTEDRPAPPLAKDRPVPRPAARPASTPEPATEDAPASTPADTEAFTRTGRRLLDNATVQTLREDYRYSRELARYATIAEEWETVGETERRLAGEYGISATSVHETVLGLRYADAPGPIDTARRARYDRYVQERETLGDKAALARMRDVDLAGSAPVVVVTITQPGEDPQDATRTIYPPGTTVSVMAVDPTDLADTSGTQDRDTATDTSTTKKGK